MGIMRINAPALALHGYKVLCATTIDEGRKMLLEYPIELIVLDIILPDGNGIQWCQQVKKERNIPILFLSALKDNSDIIEGLKVGGDDYLAKPYDLGVLIARIEARLRMKHTAYYLQFGSLNLDLLKNTARLNGEILQLTHKELTLLSLLMSNSNHHIITIRKGII